MKKLVILSFALIFAFTFTSVASAATLYVGHTGQPYRSIQDALDVSVDGDLIIVDPGDYWEGVEFPDKEITLQSEGGPAVTSINGYDEQHCISFNSTGPGAQFVGFTIYGATNEGMRFWNSSPTVRDCFVTNNGGGMNLSQNSNPLIIDCEISWNGQYYEGQKLGGVTCSYGSCPTLMNCVVSHNMTYNSGGGVYAYQFSHPHVTDCEISYNEAGSRAGGLGCDYYSSLTVDGCEVTRNQAEYTGGGAYATYTSSLLIRNSVVSYNESLDGSGGGVACENRSDLELINTNVVQNFSYGSGCGVYTWNAVGVITNCTIADNTQGAPGSTGGVYAYEANVTLTNSIVWGNVSEAGAELGVFRYGDEPASLTVIHCDVKGGKGGVMKSSDSELHWLDGNIDLDPLFVFPGEDYHLAMGSPCVDAGTFIEGLTLDIEGNPRPMGQGFDMGAYESFFSVPPCRAVASSSSSGAGILALCLVPLLVIGRKFFGQK